MRNSMVTIAAAALIGLFTAHHAAAGGKCEPAALATKYPSLAGKTIRVAQDPQGPPYAFRDPEDFDHLVGLDAEMCARLSAASARRSSSRPAVGRGCCLR